MKPRTSVLLYFGFASPSGRPFLQRDKEGQRR
jgi:hypothetical protein